MSKKSRRRNKKILGALGALGLGLALANRGKGTEMSNISVGGGKDAATMKTGTGKTIMDNMPVVPKKTNVVKTGDVLQLNLPDLKVKKVLKFKKGAQSLIIGGSHVGSIATIKDEETTRSTKPNLVMYDGFQTIRPYSFIVGEKKAMVSLPEVKV